MMTPTQQQFLDATNAYLLAFPRQCTVADVTQSLATILHVIATDAGWDTDTVHSYCATLGEIVAAGLDGQKSQAMH